MPVQDYCRLGPRTVSPQETIHGAAQLMEEHGVGSLVVVDEQTRPVGMLTDRDIVIAVAGKGRDARTTPVSRVMSKPVVTVTGGAPVGVAIRFMRQYSVRRIPIVDSQSGRLKGILTTDDVIELLAEEFSTTAALIHMQLPPDAPGQPPRSAAPEGR
jgi:CBS domain-containing protein